MGGAGGEGEGGGGGGAGVGGGGCHPMTGLAWKDKSNLYKSKTNFKKTNLFSQKKLVSYFNFFQYTSK